MKTNLNKWLYWSPRIFTICFILFISLFALDSFEGEQSVFQKSVGFLIHLIPTLVLVLLLVFSWKREWIAGITFIAFAVLYILLAWGKFPVLTYFLISGPLVVIGVLFLINWYSRIKKLKSV